MTIMAIIELIILGLVLAAIFGLFLYSLVCLVLDIRNLHQENTVNEAAREQKPEVDPNQTMVWSQITSKTLSENDLSDQVTVIETV
jgi:hypothetical protein